MACICYCLSLLLLPLIIISFFIIVITIWETILLKLVVLKKYSGYKDGFQQESSGCQESMGLEEY